jgi:hypothetical protein
LRLSSGTPAWRANARRTVGGGAGEAEAEAEAGGDVHDQVLALDLQLQGPAAAGFGEVATAVDLAAVGEDGVDPGDGAGLAVTAGSGMSSATRWSSLAGRPMWKSAPRGSAISVRETVPRLAPVMRRTTSPAR